MSNLTIFYSPRTGLLVTGTVKGDGAHSILNRRQWGPNLSQQLKHSYNIGEDGAWYLPQSRDRRSSRYRHTIDALAAALRAAGHAVTVEINDSDRRTVEEREADFISRARARVERYGTYASNAAGRAEALTDQAREMGEGIPLGQPILRGHHSEKRDRGYRERMLAKDERAADERGKATYWAGRTQAAENHQRHRYDPTVIAGRVETLTTELRRLEHNTAARDHANPAVRADWQAETEDVTERLNFWKARLAEAEENGFKVWSRTDFQRGDFALIDGQWYEIVRANPRTVTVPMTLNTNPPVITRKNSHRGMTTTIAYRKINGRMTADEMAEKMQAAEEATAENSTP